MRPNLFETCVDGAIYALFVCPSTAAVPLISSFLTSPISLFFFPSSFSSLLFNGTLFKISLPFADEGLLPYLTEIDAVTESVEKLAVAAKDLDAYSKRLEARFKQLDKR